MTLWTFSPLAAPDDPRWLDAPIWRKLVVRAPNSGTARHVAARWEARILGHDPGSGTAGGAAMDYHSALADPVLYDVRQTDGPSAEGEDEVVEVEEPLRPTPAWERLRDGEIGLS